MRASTKIAIGFVVICAVGYFVFRFITGWMIGRMHFHDLQPGNVNIVGVALGKGFHIQVANRMAQ